MPANARKVRELIEILGFLVPLLEDIREYAKENIFSFFLTDLPEDKTFSPEESADIERRLNEAANRVTEQLEVSIIAKFSTALREKEINAVIKFLKSPLWNKLARLSEEVITQAEDAAEAIMEKEAEKFTAKTDDPKKTNIQ